MLLLGITIGNDKQKTWNGEVNWFFFVSDTFMGIDACNLDNPDNPYMRESGK